MYYYKRLKEEKSALSQLTNSLEIFIHISPTYKELTAYHKKLLCLQLEFMKGYLFILNLRIEDIERTVNYENDNN